MIDGREYRTRGAPVLAAALTAMTWGCGLGDYEKHIDQRADELRQFDEENEALGSPLNMPMRWKVVAKLKVHQEALPEKFFLRPPKWILPDAKENEQFVDGKVTLYRFPGPAGYNLLFTDAFLNTDAHKAPSGGGMFAKDFHSGVGGALQHFAETEYKSFASLKAQGDPQTKSYAPRNPRESKVDFQVRVFTDAPTGVKDEASQRVFKAYFCERGSSQAAIIYQLPGDRAKNAAIDKAVELSLRTLVLGNAALDKLNEYVRQRRNAPAAK